MILDLTDEQAKFLLIICGSCAGHDGSYGVYEKIQANIKPIGRIPDPVVYESLGSIIVTHEMIDSIVTGEV